MEMWPKIENLLQTRGLNWTQFGTLIGETSSRLSKWRSGTGKPDYQQLLRMSRALGVSMEFLADDMLDRPSSPALDADAERILWAVRALGLNADEVLRRLEIAGRLMQTPNASGAVRGPKVVLTEPEPPPSAPSRRKSR